MDANIAVYIEATFQKIRCLKENEKSEVWLASGKSGRLVILKRIALTGLPYGALKKKDYPLCPRILHTWEDEGETVVVEEYVQGESLLDRIGRKAYLTEQEAQSVLIQLCDGLAPIHAQGIIHRDIKPSNLILQNGGIIRLIDFDAARTVKEHVAEDTRFLGTKGYAPPEQFGYGQTDARSDIYSIGVTLRKSLPENYCGFLSKVLAKCTAIDPDRRYRNVQELRRAAKFRSHWAKWGRLAACGVVILGILAITLKSVPENTSIPAENPPMGTVTDMPIEMPVTGEKEDTAPIEVPAPAETMPIAEPVTEQIESMPRHTEAEREPTFSIGDEAMPTPAAHRDSDSSPVANPPEAVQVMPVEELSTPVQAARSEADAKEADKDALKRKKHEEFDSRVKLFLEHLPDSMSPEEKKRAFDEYLKILGIDEWP